MRSINSNWSKKSKRED